MFWHCRTVLNAKITNENVRLINSLFTYVYTKIHCPQILFYNGRRMSLRYLCTWHSGDMDYPLKNCIHQHLKKTNVFVNHHRKFLNRTVLRSLIPCRLFVASYGVVPYFPVRSKPTTPRLENTNKYQYHKCFLTYASDTVSIKARLTHAARRTSEVFAISVIVTLRIAYKWRLCRYKRKKFIFLKKLNPLHPNISTVSILFKKNNLKDTFRNISH